MNVTRQVALTAGSVLTLIAVVVGLQSCSTDAVGTGSAQLPLPIEQVSFVPTTAAPSAPASSYAERFEQPSQRGAVHFNGNLRADLIDAQVYGIELIFDPSEPQHLLNAYHALPRLTSLTIAAERLVVRAPMHLPGTDLTIMAREIVFEDIEGQAPAKIDLSPLPRDSNLPKPRAAARVGKQKKVRAAGAGAHGERSGHLTVLAETIVGEGLRFTGTGTNGQAGGSPSKGGRVPYTIWPFMDKKSRAKLHRSIDKVIHAIEGGRPGNGGDAGTVASNLPTLEALAEFKEGTGGKTPGAKGGHAYDPIMPKNVKRRGKSAKEKTGDSGEPTSFELLESRPAIWVHPETMRAIVNRVDDLFRTGHAEQARDLAFGALEWAPHATSTDPDEVFALHTHRAQLFAVSERMASGVDYFGNPPGWVPLLSFEANYATFEKESERAIRMMFTTHWLEQYWNMQDARIEALTWSIQETEDHVAYLREGVDNAKALLPVLEEQSKEIEKDTKAFLADLRAEEKRISKKFFKKKERKRAASAALGGIGAAATVLTFVHPGFAVPAALALGGQEYINNAPAAVAENAASEAFQRILDEDDIREARERFAEMDPFAATDAEMFGYELEVVGEDLSKATRRFILEQMNATLQSTATADYNAQAELAALMKDDPEFGRLFDRLVVLITKKTVFADKLRETQSAIDFATAEILEASWAIEELKDARRRNEDRVDLESRAVLRQLRRRAQDRLVRFQYYLVKSFEYRMLQPCPITPQANRIYRHVESLFGLTESADPTQTEIPPFGAESALVADLVRIYQDDLGEIASLTIQGLNSERFEPFSSTYGVDLTANELQTLNQNGEVAIDLTRHAVIFESDRNARIIDVRIDDGSDGSAFSTRGGRDGMSRAHLDLTIEPAEQAHIRWENEALAFNYRRPHYTNIVMWGYSWRSPDGPGHPIELSDETRSLMSTLVDRSFGDTSATRQVHFRPSAHGELIIRKEISSNSADLSVHVDHLRLQIEIEKNKDFGRS